MSAASRSGETAPAAIAAWKFRRVSRSALRSRSGTGGVREQDLSLFIPYRRKELYGARHLAVTERWLTPSKKKGSGFRRLSAVAVRKVMERTLVARPRPWRQHFGAVRHRRARPRIERWPGRQDLAPQTMRSASAELARSNPMSGGYQAKQLPPRRLGAITEQGNRYLRAMLVQGVRLWRPLPQRSPTKRPGRSPIRPVPCPALRGQRLPMG
jgi:hypothetical protein